LILADFGFDDEQRDRMLGGFIAAAFYLVGEQRAGWSSALELGCGQEYLYPCCLCAVSAAAHSIALS
jgi:hypothetical protein